MFFEKQLQNPANSERIHSAIGTLVGIDEAGKPRVDFMGNTRGVLSARCALQSSDQKLLLENKEGAVLLMFENGDPKLPIITALVTDSLNEASVMDQGAGDSIDVLSSAEISKDIKNEAKIDGKKIIFDAKEEIHLKCGKSSILLKRDGRVVIKGAKVISRASGANKIKGSSVNIN